MIVTAYCHLLSDGLRQENEEENTNSIRFATSKSLSYYFYGSLFQAAGGLYLHIFAGLCTTTSSYALLLSNKTSKCCFFSFSSLLHLHDIGRGTLPVTHPQFYGLCFCSSWFQDCARTTQE